MLSKITSFFNKKTDNDIGKKRIKGKKIKIINSIEGKKLKSTVDIFDKSLYGKNAVFKLISKVNVYDSRAINKQKVLYRKNFIVNSSINDFLLDLSKYKNYSYNGKKIYIQLLVEVEIDDGIFFDTKVTSRIQESLLIKPKVSSGPKTLIDPKDNFNFLSNLKAIPYDAMAIVFGLSIIGGIIILINTIVGVHDQFVMESQTYFYSHTSSDGENNYPLFNSLAGSGTLGAGIWFLIKSQLRRYMTFIFKKEKFLGDRKKSYKVRDIVTGKSKVDLENVRLKIVACNMEKGQYRRGSGTKSRTISFSEPIRVLSLYDEKIDFIAKNTDISEYFKGEVSFENMYKALYPEQVISSSHGITVYWEVQLIHNNFIDQELIGDFSFFKYEHFLKG